ncbi:MAG: hypothetical protein JHC93_03390 [Parachlamydiales bacterium]|nr:hypothetical protein [Parachlamydiales bacterium]
MRWRRLNTGKNSAKINMELDQKILLDADSCDDAIFHTYDWIDNSATYGHFINPFNFLNEQSVKSAPLDIARRPTGGGVVFHITDLAFSVMVPSTHPLYSTHTLSNYTAVNHCVLQAIKTVGINLDSYLLPQDPTALDSACQNFCMAKPTIYDVMIGSKKIGGAAQRKTKLGFLHQGTISIAPLAASVLESFLLPGTKVLEAMQANSAYLVDQQITKTELTEWRNRLNEALWTALLQASPVDVKASAC